MKISKIWLRQFRNIKEQMISFGPGLNIFKGPNGQGKTNLIEAVYLLTCGKSFRTSDISFLINKNDFSGFCLESEVLKRNIYHHIKIAVSKGIKSVKIDEKTTTASMVKKNFSSVLFSPDTLQIIKDSDKKRRELVDELCLFLFPDFYDVYISWQRLLKQKNGLLKRIREKQISFYQGEELNELLSFQFLKKSSQFCAFRLEAIKRISNILSEKFLGITKNDRVKVSMEYTLSKERVGVQGEEENFNAMYKEWKKKRKLEITLGQCLVGPHRHGIKFKFNGQDARFFCSQGQQRAIILAFKIAQVELYYRVHGEFPILLMDDVFSELDGQRQMNFLKELLLTKSQIFLTTVEDIPLGYKGSFSTFRVEKGVFKRAETSSRERVLNV